MFLRSFREDKDTPWAFFGFSSTFVTNGKLAMNTSSFVLPSDPPAVRRPEEAPLVDVCVLFHESARACDAVRRNSGTFVISLLARFLPAAPRVVEQNYSHLAVRTRMDIVGADGTWSGLDEFENSMMLSLQMNGNTIDIDLPIAYNVGKIKAGLLSPWQKIAASTKVTRSLESNQSIYVDYIFEIPKKAGSFFVSTTSIEISIEASRKISTSNISVEPTQE